MSFFGFIRPFGEAWLLTSYPYKVYGRENLIQDGNVVIICNHLSKMDVPMIGHIFKGKTYYLAKKEWFNKKWRAKLFTALGAIPLDRDHIDIEATKAALGVLKNGKRLCIFPEGTRNRESTEIMKLRGGAGVFAFKSKSVILPINIHHKPKFWGKNYLYVGKPFDFSEFYGRKLDGELNEKLTEKMYRELCKAKEELQEILEKEGKVKKS